MSSVKSLKSKPINKAKKKRKLPTVPAKNLDNKESDEINNETTNEKTDTEKKEEKKDDENEKKEAELEKENTRDKENDNANDDEKAKQTKREELDNDTPNQKNKEPQPVSDRVNTGKTDQESVPVEQPENKNKNKHTLHPEAAQERVTSSRLMVGEPEKARSASREQNRMASAKPLREPSRIASSKSLREPSRMASTQSQREPSRMASAKPQRESTRMASAKPLREPSRIASSKPLREPSRMASTQLQREPSRMASTQSQREPSRMASTQSQREPSRMASAKPLREPRRMASAKPLREPSRIASSKPPSRMPSSTPRPASKVPSRASNRGFSAIPRDVWSGYERGPSALPVLVENNGIPAEEDPVLSASVLTLPPLVQPEDIELPLIVRQGSSLDQSLVERGSADMSEDDAQDVVTETSPDLGQPLILPAIEPNKRETIEQKRRRMMVGLHKTPAYVQSFRYEDGALKRLEDNDEAEKKLHAHKWEAEETELLERSQRKAEIALTREQRAFEDLLGFVKNYERLKDDIFKKTIRPPSVHHDIYADIDIDKYGIFHDDIDGDPDLPDIARDAIMDLAAVRKRIHPRRQKDHRDTPLSTLEKSNLGRPIFTPQVEKPLEFPNKITAKTPRPSTYIAPRHRDYRLDEINMPCSCCMERNNQAKIGNSYNPESLFRMRRVLEDELREMDQNTGFYRPESTSLVPERRVTPAKTFKDTPLQRPVFDERVELPMDNTSSQFFMPDGTPTTPKSAPEKMVTEYPDDMSNGMKRGTMPTSVPVYKTSSIMNMEMMGARLDPSYSSAEMVVMERLVKATTRYDESMNKLSKMIGKFTY